MPNNKHDKKKEAESDLNSEFKMKGSGDAIHKLLSNAQPVNVDNRHLDEYYNTRIAKYSIQFQGCNQIKHWNKDAEDEDDVRISTKRLVRFRLVPFEKCSAYNPWMDASGIQNARNMIGKADYGDYVVDMNTFVEAYLQTKANGNGGDDDANNGNNGNGNYYAADDANAFNGFDIGDYVQCAAFDFDGNDDGNGNGDDANANANDIQYYLGPYCAEHGGEIRLNLFEDDTCTTVTKCNGGSTRGANCYTQVTGNTIPYTQDSDSIIDDPCVPCSQNYQYLDSVPDGELDSDYDFGYPRDACATLYDEAGKCEKYMKNGEYDYACTYIQGIKIGMSRDGYAVAVRRSMGADAAMATLAIGCTFLGMYIYYLRYVLKKVDIQKYKKDFYVPSHTLT